MRYRILAVLLTVALLAGSMGSASAHIGWHYVSTYCYAGYYRDLYAYAYYYNPYSNPQHLWGQRYEANTWYRC